MTLMDQEKPMHPLQIMSPKCMKQNTQDYKGIILEYIIKLFFSLWYSNRYAL